LSPGRQLDLLDHDSPRIVGLNPNSAAIRKSCFEERPLRDCDPSLLVDHRLPALAKLALVVGRLDPPT
jgi:hypothetical protein